MKPKDGGEPKHLEGYSEKKTTITCERVEYYYADDVKKIFPRALHDPLVYDYVDEMKLTLDGRADLQQRFGVPEIATPTRSPGKSR